MTDTDANGAALKLTAATCLLLDGYFVQAKHYDALAVRLAEAERQRDVAVVALKKLDRRMDNLDTWNTGVHDIVAPALARIKETRDD